MVTKNDTGPRVLKTGMDLELLRRNRRSSLISGSVMSIPVAYYVGPLTGAGFAAGVLWSVLNLALITSLIRNTITLEDRPLRRILVALAIKFPVLYGAGFLMLKAGLPPIWLVTGFTWPFVVLLLKGLGRAFLRMDDDE